MPVIPPLGFPEEGPHKEEPEHQRRGRLPNTRRPFAVVGRGAGGFSVWLCEPDTEIWVVAGDWRNIAENLDSIVAVIGVLFNEDNPKG